MAKYSIVDSDTDRKVVVIRDSKIIYPELWMEVFIGPGPENERKPFAEFFAKARCTKADSPEKSDLVVFVGGSDVNPALYGEDRHPTTFFDSAQDERDMELYRTCYENGIPMLGICRGAQFLNVMNGGKLYQDVDGHVGDHHIYDIKGKRIIHKVSSVHHQMCIENRDGGMEVLADSSAASVRWLNPTDKVAGSRMDVEAFFYRESCCIGIQGHPEYKGYDEFAYWSIDLIQKYIVENPDVEFIKRFRRVKPDLLKERQTIRDQKAKELN